jgi:hypothetical protein
MPGIKLSHRLYHYCLPSKEFCRWGSFLKLTWLFPQDGDGCDNSEEVTQERPPTRRCDALWSWWGRRRCSRAGGQAPPSDKRVAGGAVHCEGFIQVARVARAPARKAARTPSRAMRSGRGDCAPDRGCHLFFLFRICCDRALWTRGC